jgi:hypothetical protein
VLVSDTDAATSLIGSLAPEIKNGSGLIELVRCLPDILVAGGEQINQGLIGVTKEHLERSRRLLKARFQEAMESLQELETLRCNNVLDRCVIQDG